MTYINRHINTLLCTFVFFPILMLQSNRTLGCETFKQNNEKNKEKFKQNNEKKKKQVNEEQKTK